MLRKETSRCAPERLAPSATKTPGGAFEPCGLPDPPGWFLIWPDRVCCFRGKIDPTQDSDGLDTLALSAGVTLRIPAWQGTRSTEAVVVVTVIRLVGVAAFSSASHS